MGSLKFHHLTPVMHVRTMLGLNIKSSTSEARPHGQPQVGNNGEPQVLLYPRRLAFSAEPTLVDPYTFANLILGCKMRRYMNCAKGQQIPDYHE